MTAAMPYSAFFAFADCAARSFAENRTARRPGAENATCRTFLRDSAVIALWHLWRTADAAGRVTVACRVAVWMGRPVKEIQARVMAREKLRIGPSQVLS